MFKLTGGRFVLKNNTPPPVVAFQPDPDPEVTVEPQVTVEPPKKMVIKATPSKKTTTRIKGTTNAPRLTSDRLKSGDF